MNRPVRTYAVHSVGSLGDGHRRKHAEFGEGDGDAATFAKSLTGETARGTGTRSATRAAFSDAGEDSGEVAAQPSPSPGADAAGCPTSLTSTARGSCNVSVALTPTAGREARQREGTAAREG